MPRKTKEQKDLEENKKATKKATSKSKTKAEKKSDETKKAATKTSPTKKVTAKKTTTKKASTTKKTATKKSSTAKKTADKKVATKKSDSIKKSASTKKTTTAKKSSSTAKSTTKKATTKKASTAKKTSTKKAATKSKKTATSKKNSLVDKTLEIAEYYDLPYRYNKTVVKILAQTPSTLFVYWEISDADMENYKKQYGENFFEITIPVLIVHNETLGYSFEIDINDFANSWYLKVNNSKCSYKIELGRRPIEKNNKITENYIYIATSNDIEAPNDHILIENLTHLIKFRNIKNNNEFYKDISNLPIIKKINKVYDIYKLIYQDENFVDLTNPSSGTFSSTFK